MNRVFRSVAGLLALSFPLAPTGLSQIVAQDGSSRKTGTIFKAQVDGLIRLVRGTAGNGPLGGESVLDTAKILTAMGHCHRRYHHGDGPVVRASLAFLIRSRQADGSFGDSTATAWVIEAFSVMDPDGYEEEVAQARRWLAGQDGKAASFARHVERVLEKVRADLWPEQLCGTAKIAVDDWLASGKAPEDGVADTLLAFVACQAANRALDRGAKQDPAAAKVFTPAQQKAFAWLMTQHEDGVFSVSFGGRSIPDPAFTGFGLLALQTKPKAMRTKEEQAAIDNGLRWLLTKQNDDGTFGEQVPNYTTCVVVAALTRWENPTLGPVLKRAQKAILGFQNIEASGYRESDRDYGSIGYGSSQRGDLSNLHFSLEALKATGLPDDHEAFAKAIVFLQRTQNLKSVNDFSGKVPDPEREGELIDAKSGDDGGATYYPGNSNAGYLVQPDGKSVARSYGSMTYSLLKAYTLAGVKRDDPRIKAAVKWIQKNWDLATNPGADPALGEKVKYQGLFYYYMVLAQALETAGIDTVEVPRGATPDGDEVIEEIEWKKALRDHLAGMQKEDGTWKNGKNDRWMEGLDLLCTCYAMVALELCN